MGRAKNSKPNLKNKFLIYTNGDTEVTYFKLLKSYSVYDVKITKCTDRLIDLIERAVIGKEESRNVWCVFDIDYTYEQKQLEPALKLAKKHDIKIAYSNVSFEVWLLSHFVEFNKALNAKDINKELEKQLKQKYNKADEKQLKSKFIPRTKIAMENAKSRHQKLLKEYYQSNKIADIEPIWEWNPSTTIYKLLEVMGIYFDKLKK